MVMSNGNLIGSNRASGINTRSSATLSAFISEIRENVESVRARDLAHLLDRRLHPKIDAIRLSGNKVAIIAPLLPVHEIIPQRFLRSRARKRVYVEGRGVFQSFYNPRRSRDNFIVAWYRYPPIKRLPISFVLRDPTPYIRRRIRDFLSRGGVVEPYERIFPDHSTNFGGYSFLGDDTG